MGWLSLLPIEERLSLAGIETPCPQMMLQRSPKQVDPAPMMGGPFVASTNGAMSDSEPRAKDESWTEEMEKPQ